MTYNLASRNRTFYEDVALVKGLPKVPTIVFIGVNLGRYTGPYTTKTISLTPDPERSANYTPHHHSSAHILSLARKKAMVTDWMKRRYPVFQSRYRYNLKQLRRLIVVCKRLGLHPVMLDLPRNMDVIKDAFYRPIQRYHQGCRALAKEFDVPFVNFIRDANLVNRDFFDLAHMVEPGRTKWQRLLSDKTIRMLKRFGMMPPIYETPTPTPSAAPVS